jgi:hypothetical protein
MKMSLYDTEPEAPTFWQTFFKVMQWVAVIVLIGLVLGIALYFTVPYVQKRYIQPVEDNTIKLQQLDVVMAQVSQLHNQDLEQMQSRIDQVDQANQDSAADLKAIQLRLSAVETAQAQQAESGEMVALEADIENLQTQLDAIQEDQTLVAGQIIALVTPISQASSQIESALAAGVQSYLDQQLVRLMVIVTRARFNLVEGNISLASSDLQAAVDAFEDLQENVTDEQKAYLSAVIEKLEAALGELPDSPLAAADQLEAAWQLLVAGLPVDTSLFQFPAATPTPES